MWLCVSYVVFARVNKRTNEGASEARDGWTQHDDSSAPNVLYHFSIPFYLALDIFSMQTHPTIHLFVIVFAVVQRIFWIFFPSSASSNVTPASTAAAIIIIVLSILGVFVCAFHFLLSVLVIIFTKVYMCFFQWNCRLVLTHFTFPRDQSIGFSTHFFITSKVEFSPFQIVE